MADYCLHNLKYGGGAAGGGAFLSQEARLYLLQKEKDKEKEEGKEKTLPLAWLLVAEGLRLESLRADARNLWKLVSTEPLKSAQQVQQEQPLAGEPPLTLSRSVRNVTPRPIVRPSLFRWQDMPD